MDNNEFKISEKKSDIYFSNDVQSSNNLETKKGAAVSSGETKKAAKRKKKKGIGATYLFFIIVIACSMALSIYAIFCMNDILAITKTTSSVTVSLTQKIETSDDAIDILSSNGLLRCKNFCKVFVKVRDKFIHSSSLGGPYEAGVYYLNGKMGLEGMLITLQGDNATSETIQLTFPEGYTVPDIIDKLAENDVCDRNALISVIQSTNFDFRLTGDLKLNDSVPYRLEGFMFPDTYEFFIDESAASAVRKFLQQGNNVYTKKYSDRAKELGYTDYEVITIASIIQKEAANEDQMKLISAIIHNRLEDTVNFPTLGCQSTSDYITNKVAPSLSSQASHSADYYMTYYNTNNNSTVVGLPAGPICNPGKAAIQAALHPADSDARFFFHDNSGEMYTAKTLQEFKEKVEKYAPYLEH